MHTLKPLLLVALIPLYTGATLVSAEEVIGRSPIYTDCRQPPIEPAAEKIAAH